MPHLAQRMGRAKPSAIMLVAEKARASGHSYRLMIGHVKRVLADIQRVVPGHDASEGHELAGFVWFQGWNDMVDQGA